MKHTSFLRRTSLCVLALLCPLFAHGQNYTIPETINLRPGCDVVEGNLVDCDPDVEMPFEEYLTVVVASEMSAYWGNYDPVAGGEKEGMHALMAQAVAARSYAIQYAAKNGFVCDHSEACQRYNYAIAEALGLTGASKVFPPPASNSHYNAYLAVKNTAGFVLTWPDWNSRAGEPAPAYYAASTNSYVGPATPSKNAAGITCLSDDTPVDGMSGGTFSFPCFEDADVGTHGYKIFPNKGFPRLGHGAGMSQTGALRWATGRYWNPADLTYKNDTFDYAVTPYASTNEMGDPIPYIVRKDWLQILSHYYIEAYKKQGQLPPFEISVIPGASAAHTAAPDVWQGVEVFIKNGAQVSFPETDAGPLVLGADHAGRATRLVIDAGSQLVDRNGVKVEDGSRIVCEGTCSYFAGANLGGADKFGNGASLAIKSGGTLRLGADGLSTLGDGAYLYTEAGGTLVLEDHAQLVFDAKASIGNTSIASGTRLIMGEGAKILFEVPVAISSALGNLLPFERLDPLNRRGYIQPKSETDGFMYVVFDGGDENVDDPARSLDLLLSKIVFLAQNGAYRKSLEKLAYEFENPDPDLLKVQPDFSLGSAYPNPFNPRVTIPFSLPHGGHVRMEVFDVMGRHVRTLVNGYYAGGDHTVVFEASNLSSGMYLLRAGLLYEDSEVHIHTQRLALMQ